MPIITKWGKSIETTPLRELRKRKGHTSFGSINLLKGHTSFGSINLFKGSKKGKEDDDSDKDKEEAIDFMKMLAKKPKESSEDNFYTMDNNIYFQEEISLETISSLNRQIRELSTELLAFASKYDMTEPPPIKLHITSYGGSVIAAFSAIDCIE